MAYRYDNETGGFVPQDEAFAPEQKKDSDAGSWIIIALLFAFGLWPVGLIALVSKLRDTPHKKGSAAQKADTSAAGKAAAKATAAAQKMTRSPNVSSKAANILSAIGLAVTGVFGLGLLGIIGDAVGYGFSASAWEDLFVTSGFCLGGIVTLCAGWRMKKRTKRMARYLAAIAERPYVSVSELAGVVGKKEKTVERDLECMIEKGMLGSLAYIDSSRGILFRSAGAMQQYAQEKSGAEDSVPEEADEGYAGILRSIRSANDRIPDAVISEKIDRIEELTGRILAQIEAHPEKQAQAGKFMNYYLPTTLKLLDSYAQFDAAGIEGENLRQAKSRIADTFDNLIVNFERQLDALYSDEARDIDSDIRVMETMLNVDNASAERDFGMGAAAVQRQE